MEIKATVNGTEYKPVNSVTAGGKTASLVASADLEAVEITIGKNGDTEITPSVGKDGIGKVILHTQVEGAGGIGAYEYIKKAYQLFNNATLPNVFKVEFPVGVTALQQTFEGCSVTTPSDPSKITLSCAGQITNLQSCFNNATSRQTFKEIEINFDTSHVANWSQAFWKTGATKLIGALNLSAATNVTSMFGYSSFKEIEFVPNTIPISIEIVAGVLTNATLVSIANGLEEGATGLNVKLSTASKTAMGSIVGTVAMDESNTYHIFTASDSGTTTLTDFITNTKGWTIT